MQPNLGVADENRAEVLRFLRTTLADEAVLAAKTRGFGWNVVGPQFHDLHILFARQYADMDGLANAVAEALRARGAIAPTSLTEHVHGARLREEPGRQPAAREMVAVLLTDHETLIRCLREDAANCSGKDLDAGAAALLVDLMEKHSRMAWMLRAFLETPVG